MVVGAQLSVRTVSGFGIVSYQRNASGPWISNKPNSLVFSSSTCCSRCRSSTKSSFCTKRCHRQAKWVVRISCNSSRGSSSGGDHDNHDEFLESSLLVSETIWHYRTVRRGFQEDMKWQSSTQVLPLSIQAKGSRPDFSSIGQGFLRRFPNPTIFLKISCDGDFLLPIVVGEFAIEKLVDASWGDNSGDCPDQFQFVRNVAEDLGYEVKMVRITERVVNTYFAKLYFSKAGKHDILSVDVRPSDGINVAYRCKAPIYVSKQVVLADAIRIGYGMARPHNTKATYDVSLDSAIDGPDLLAEELHMIRNMNLAVQEERYNDAAIWRDKLTRLRKSKLDI